MFLNLFEFTEVFLKIFQLALCEQMLAPFVGHRWAFGSVGPVVFEHLHFPMFLSTNWLYDIEETADALGPLGCEVYILESPLYSLVG